MTKFVDVGIEACLLKVQILVGYQSAVETVSDVEAAQATNVLKLQMATIAIHVELYTFKPPRLNPKGAKSMGSY